MLFKVDGRYPTSGGVEMSQPEHADMKFEIQIDHEHFTVQEPVLTGTQLRNLPSPPIDPDRDLFEEIAGPGDDILIGDEQQVELRNGLHFFSAPRRINPGGC